MAGPKAYIGALWRHALGIVGGGAIVVLIGIGERWAGKNVPWGVYVGVMALGLITATFKAWEEEHQKRVSAELRLVDRPRIELRYDVADPSCREVVDEQRVRFRVGVFNLGPVRADGVAIALQASEPALPAAKQARFQEMGTGASAFAVAPVASDGTPATYVEILRRRQFGTSGIGAMYQLATGNIQTGADGHALPGGIRLLRLVLRVDALVQCEPLTMLFEADGAGLLEPVTPREYDVDFSSSVRPSWWERWRAARKAKP